MCQSHRSAAELHIPITVQSGFPSGPQQFAFGGLGGGGAEECVLELCIWELLGETACAQAFFALTQMYDDLCDPVLQLEIQV